LEVLGFGEKKQFVVALRIGSFFLSVMSLFKPSLSHKNGTKAFGERVLEGGGEIK